MKLALRKHLAIIGVCCGVVVLSSFFFSRTAGAYAVGAGENSPPITTGTVSGYLNQVGRLMNSNASLPTAPSWLSEVLNMATQWFQNITAQGAQSMGAPNFPITISAGPLGNITMTGQNLFAQFDAWLYGIIHFHISLIVYFVFGLVGWVLGIAKYAVNWLNSVFGSAAGK